MVQKTARITGWVLTLMIAFVIAMSAFLKLTQNDAALAQASSVGLNPETYFWIGVIEIVALILFIIPKTGIIGTLLLAAYFGGAIVTHLEHHQPVFVAVIVQVAVWVTAFIRFPELTQRLITVEN